MERVKSMITNVTMSDLRVRYGKMITAQAMYSQGAVILPIVTSLTTSFNMVLTQFAVESLRNGAVKPIRIPPYAPFASRAAMLRLGK
jgi:hypothetical protein